ncbi:hypothetical protein FOCC_FOCC000691 [Frankliniella occidentalis]|nr:hypothetical protein FOCC_FOCC000691 [Frankliniella occidentalis]
MNTFRICYLQEGAAMGPYQSRYRQPPRRSSMQTFSWICVGEFPQGKFVSQFSDFATGALSEPAVSGCFMWLVSLKKPNKMQPYDMCKVSECSHF